MSDRESSDGDDRGANSELKTLVVILFLFHHMTRPS